MCLAVPAKVIEIKHDGLAIVELMGVRREASLELLDDVKIGDFVILHVGYALQKLDLKEAEESLKLLKSIGYTKTDIGDA